MEFHQGKTGGWMLIGECPKEGIEDEGFCPFLVVTLIRKYPQEAGVKVHKPLKAVLKKCSMNLISLSNT